LDSFLERFRPTEPKFYHDKIEYFNKELGELKNEKIANYINNYPDRRELEQLKKTFEHLQISIYDFYNEINECLIDYYKSFLNQFNRRKELINQENHKGQTPLLKAIECKWDKFIIKWLIENGANLHHRDMKGKTALFYAFRNNLPDIVKILIENGACLHYKCEEKRFILQNIDNYTEYRNALIKELSDTFKYTDHELFKEKVIESIENEQVTVLEYAHLKALSNFISQSNDETTLNEVKEHLKTLEFQEKLFEGFINVLVSEKECLELRKNQLFHNFKVLSHLYENKRLNSNESLLQFKLRDFILDGACQDLVDLIKSEANQEHQLSTFSNMIGSINKYIEIITRKISLGREVSNLLETELK